MTEFEKQINCYHCGDVCNEDDIKIDDKYFCCNGCMTVHQLLSNSDMEEYYKQINFDGKTGKRVKFGEYDFLDDEKIKTSLLDFTIEDKSKVTFYLPQVYCSACIYIIENLTKLDNGILESKVNFLKKETSILFNNNDTSLKKIVELLTSIGYRPQLNLADINKPKKNSGNKSLFIKIGIAGFCFGNVMLLALPDYFAGGLLEPSIKHFFGYLTLFLGLLVLYASSDYFKSAYTSLRVNHISIDLPISIGVVVLYLRSFYDIVSYSGSGFIDSLAALIFFLLVGKSFQQKTYYHLSFDRNYTSYFPLSVIMVKDGREKFVPVLNVKIYDRLIIRSNEIIPTDSILISDHAEIDYSFVTGESRPVSIKQGDRIYAGGKQTAGSITVETIKNFNQSYLTELWNRDIFSKNSKKSVTAITDRVAKYFTIAILIIGFAAFFYWIPTDISRAFNSLTSVLIIACPCALALTVPFTFGTALRVYAKNQFYLKNDLIIEKLSNIKKIVFDKTGTLTYHNTSDLKYQGEKLNDLELQYIKSVAKNSTHPLSMIIANNINSEISTVNNYQEISGSGIEAVIDNINIRLGSYRWLKNITGMTLDFSEKKNLFRESSVFVSINNHLKGSFIISSKYRDGIRYFISELENDYKIAVISGDNDSERENLENILTDKSEIHFNQLPEEKFNYITKQVIENSGIMMVGDGLNDIGALQASDVGIAITENTANFTPGSDAILLGDKLNKLPQFMKFSRKAMKTVKLCFKISLFYNVIGLSYAVQGHLSPVIAAILMPVSSITVVLFTVLKVKYDSKKLGL
jgi:Cu+-exporting ATPase